MTGSTPDKNGYVSEAKRAIDNTAYSGKPDGYLVEIMGAAALVVTSIAIAMHSARQSTPTPQREHQKTTAVSPEDPSTIQR